MGLTKTELFTERQNELARIAKALAHPARIAIIDCLLNTDRCITGDLVDETGLAQATISQHLRELKDIGIIRGNIEGVSVRYCIDPVRWQEIQLSLDSMFNRFHQCHPSCGC
jgi:DNA-binding transcriptional ArsR family regulator